MHCSLIGFDPLTEGEQIVCHESLGGLLLVAARLVGIRRRWLSDGYHRAIQVTISTRFISMQLLLLTHLPATRRSRDQLSPPLDPANLTAWQTN